MYTLPLTKKQKIMRWFSSDGPRCSHSNQRLHNPPFKNFATAFTRRQDTHNLQIPITFFHVASFCEDTPFLLTWDLPLSAVRSALSNSLSWDHTLPRWPPQVIRRRFASSALGHFTHFWITPPPVNCVSLLSLSPISLSSRSQGIRNSTLLWSQCGIRSTRSRFAGFFSNLVRTMSDQIT